MGDQLYMIALLWTATQIGSSNVGIVASAQWLPRLVFGLIGGTLSDRWDRRRMLITLDLLRAGLVFVFALLATSGEVGLPGLVEPIFRMPVRRSPLVRSSAPGLYSLQLPCAPQEKDPRCRPQVR
jgi:MFS family permease